ncbi:MAG: PQQ-binding-like beta-propeller repeat protein [Verrucomicrobiae bacterium]|nr:PQQ-binding-like beta-propeller repeat protein [Verrucomicrobiae bacterium]
MKTASSFTPPSLVLFATLLVAPLAARAENWPQWRGPFFNGSTTESGLPTQWSTTENVAWKTPLPGRSGATPVVWGDSVFVVSPDADKNLLLLCINRADGKVRWKQIVATGDWTKGKNNTASCSPVTDGRVVVAIFATGDIAAFDFTGRRLWARNLANEYGKFALMWIYGASPLLYGGKLYVPVLQRNPPTYEHAQDDKPQRESYLLCLDPQTGRNLWRHIRKSDAPGESQEAYTTPIPYEGRSGLEILLFGGDCLTSHRADTGAELWRWAGVNPAKKTMFRVVPSPATSPGFAYVCGPKGEPVYAIKTGGQGDVTSTHLAWKLDDVTCDVPTPLYYQGKLFVLNGNKQILTCLDPKTGAKKWEGSLGNFGRREVFSASPTGADGRVYCISEAGTVVALSAGDEFKVLSTIPMGEGPGIMSSVVAAHGRLLVRTSQNLYCIGGKRP